MKKTITIIIVVLVALGFGLFLFKISPQQDQAAAGSYNSALNVKDFKTIETPPAFDPLTDRYQGSPTAKNVFVEYADYQCPACAAYSDILKQVPVAFKDTVFVYRYFPLTNIHPNSVESAVAAEAAGAQGKYWEMHDLLFKNQASWQDLKDPLETFAGYARQAGVANIDQFKADVANKKHLPAVQKNSNEALGLKLPGTPSFFFNGHVLQNQDLAGLQKQAEAFYIK